MTPDQLKRLETLEAQMAFAKAIFEKIIFKDKIQDRLHMDNLEAHKETDAVVTAIQAELGDSTITAEEIAKAFEAAAADVRGG